MRCVACGAILLANVEQQLPACIAQLRSQLEQTNELVTVLRSELEGLRRQLHNLNLGSGYPDN